MNEKEFFLSGPRKNGGLETTWALRQAADGAQSYPNSRRSKGPSKLGRTVEPQEIAASIAFTV